MAMAPPITCSIALVVHRAKSVSVRCFLEVSVLGSDSSNSLVWLETLEVLSWPVQPLNKPCPLGLKWAWTGVQPWLLVPGQMAGRDVQRQPLFFSAVKGGEGGRIKRVDLH